MKTLILTLTSLLSFDAFSSDGPVRLSLSSEIHSNSTLPFISHRGPGNFDNSLAYNVLYEPVKALRKPIEEKTRKKLKFFTSWNPQGEAHVTVITPPEFSEILSKYLSMVEIDSIAQKEKIQSSELVVLGLGSGKANIDSQLEETFFIIVDSENLRNIRHKIYLAFVKNGGSPSAWDPTWWFPHITIGYTKRDLHESDGVMKNIKGSWDMRFHLVVR